VNSSRRKKLKLDLQRTDWWRWRLVVLFVYIWTSRVHRDNHKSNSKSKQEVIMLIPQLFISVSTFHLCLHLSSPAPSSSLSPP